MTFKLVDNGMNLATYRKGLEAWRKRQEEGIDPLDSSKSSRKSKTKGRI